jgi:ferredoxin
VAAGSTLRDAVQRAGLPLAGACAGDALCGRCGVTVLSGAGSLSAESPHEARVKRRNRVPAGHRLACCAVVSGDLELTASYW